MFLTTDGTAVALLEARVGEPIITRTMRRSGPATLVKLEAEVGQWWRPDTKPLRIEPTEHIVARRVTLDGARSGMTYVLADSIVATERLAPETATELLQAGASVGPLRAPGTATTRREILGIGRKRAGTAWRYLGVAPSSMLGWRTYLIWFEGSPAIVVTELLAPGRLAWVAREHSLPPVERAERRGRTQPRWLESTTRQR